MRGDMGLATLILFIVIILMATIAAVVLLQATNAVKNQAQLTQQESQAKFRKKLSVQKMMLIVDRHMTLTEGNETYYNPYYNKARVIWLWVQAPPSGSPVDLRKVILTFQTGDMVKIAKYLDADGDDVFGDNACQTDDPYPWPSSQVAYLFPTVEQQREENTMEEGKGVNYDALVDGDAFTVVWVNCDGHDEDYLIYPGQLAILIYMPPGGLDPSTRFKITLSVPDGGVTEVETMTPDVYGQTFIDVPV